MIAISARRVIVSFVYLPFGHGFLNHTLHGDCDRGKVGLLTLTLFQHYGFLSAYCIDEASALKPYFNLRGKKNNVCYLHLGLSLNVPGDPNPIQSTCVHVIS